MDSEPVYTEQQAAILAVVASLQTELRLTREQQGRDSALFREQATKDNAAIVFQLDKLNTSDSRHGEWIDGRIKRMRGPGKAHRNHHPNLPGHAAGARKTLCGRRGAYRGPRHDTPRRTEGTFSSITIMWRTSGITGRPDTEAAKTA